MGPQEGGTKDQVAPGMPVGGCRWLWEHASEAFVGHAAGVGAVPSSPFLLHCPEEVISLCGHSTSKVDFPVRGRNCQGTLGMF